MAESNLSLALTELQDRISRKMGYGDDYTSIAASKQAIVDNAIKSGLRRFYAEREWQFLRVPYRFTTTAPYVTGTVEIVAGVVTLSGGTFPSWAADGDLVVGGSTYDVSTRDGNTQVTLVDTSVAADAGSAYSLQRNGYELPYNFGQMLGSFTFEANTHWTPVQMVSETQLRFLRQAESTDGVPQYAAVRWKEGTSASEGQRAELLLWPNADAAYILTGKYLILPDTMASGTPYPYGGMLHGETVLRACLAEIENDEDDEIGVAEAKYQQALARSIVMDRAMAPESMGFNGNPGGGLNWKPSDLGWVTYNGALYGS